MHFESLLTFKQLVVSNLQYIRPFLFPFFMFSGKSVFSPQIAAKRIQFKPVFGSHPLLLNNSAHLTTKSAFKFKALKFYVSSIQLLFMNKIVYSESNCHHLIDVAMPSSLHITLGQKSAVEYDAIVFNFGLENLTNILGAMNRDSYSINSMYCDGETGYVIFKLEGNCSGKGFLFYLGGYQAPFQTWQKIKLDTQDRDIIDVYFDVKQFVETIEIAQLNSATSPSKEASEISEILANCFYH